MGLQLARSSLYPRMLLQRQDPRLYLGRIIHEFRKSRSSTIQKGSSRVGSELSPMVSKVGAMERIKGCTPWQTCFVQSISDSNVSFCIALSCSVVKRRHSQNFGLYNYLQNYIIYECQRSIGGGLPFRLVLAAFFHGFEYSSTPGSTGASVQQITRRQWAGLRDPFFCDFPDSGILCTGLEHFVPNPFHFPRDVKRLRSSNNSRWCALA